MTDPLFLAPRTIGRFSRTTQILAVVLLQLLTIALALWEYAMHGTMWNYPVFSASILFVALYEEALFRGAILGWLKTRMPAVAAIAISSALFGVWHAKNMLWMDPMTVVRQMLYTGIVIGPVLAWITLKTRNIWPAIVLHQLNNILASPIIHDILRP